MVPGYHLFLFCVTYKRLLVLDWGLGWTCPIIVISSFIEFRSSWFHISDYLYTWGVFEHKRHPIEQLHTQQHCLLRHNNLFVHPWTGHTVCNRSSDSCYIPDTPFLNHYYQANYHLTLTMPVYLCRNCINTFVQKSYSGQTWR